MYTPARENSNRCLVVGHFSRGKTIPSPVQIHAVDDTDSVWVTVGHENSDCEWIIRHFQLRSLRYVRVSLACAGRIKSLKCSRSDHLAVRDQQIGPRLPAAFRSVLGCSLTPFHCRLGL